VEPEWTIRVLELICPAGHRFVRKTGTCWQSAVPLPICGSRAGTTGYFPDEV